MSGILLATLLLLVEYLYFRYIRQHLADLNHNVPQCQNAQCVRNFLKFKYALDLSNERTR